MTYKNIVFDLDDTLYDHQLPFKRSVEKCFPTINIQQIDNIYKRFRYWSDVAFPKYTKKLISIEELRIFRCQKTMEEFGINSISRTEALDFQADYEYELNQITMIPEIHQLLLALHENHIPIGILTNGPVDLQSRKLQLIGAYQYFEKKKIIISQTTGYSKPQQEIFDYTAKKLNFLPSESLYIGDTFINDIEGSYNAGWHPIWFNHRNRQIAKEKEEMPAYEVFSASELRDLVLGLFDINHDFK